MRMHTATTPLPATTALGRNPTPSTSTTMLCPKKNTGTKTREMVDRLVPFQHMGKAGISRRLAQQIEMGIRQTGSTMANSPCNLPLQTPKSRPPHQTVQRTAAAAVVSSFRPLPPSTPNRCVSRLHPRIFSFYVIKSPPVIGPGLEHQPQVSHGVLIVRVRRESRVKLVGYKVPE